MYSKFYSPNIIATGSSEIDQSSYSHHADNDVGVAVIDRYTYYNLDFLEKEVTDKSSKKTLGDLFGSYDVADIHSDPGFRWDLFPGGEDAGRQRLLMDFFGNVQEVEVEQAGNSTELEEDILGLGRKIREYRQRAEMEEKAVNESQSVDNEPVTTMGESVIKTQQMLRKRAAKVELDKDWLSRKVVGSLAVLGCATAWMAGSWLGL